MFEFVFAQALFEFARSRPQSEALSELPPHSHSYPYPLPTLPRAWARSFWGYDLSGDLSPTPPWGDFNNFYALASIFLSSAEVTSLISP